MPSDTYGRNISFLWPNHKISYQTPTTTRSYNIYYSFPVCNSFRTCRFVFCLATHFHVHVCWASSELHHQPDSPLWWWNETFEERESSKVVQSMISQYILCTVLFISLASKSPSQVWVPCKDFCNPLGIAGLLSLSLCPFYTRSKIVPLCTHSYWTNFLQSQHSCHFVIPRISLVWAKHILLY